MTRPLRHRHRNLGSFRARYTAAYTRLLKVQAIDSGSKIFESFRRDWFNWLAPLCRTKLFPHLFAHLRILLFLQENTLHAVLTCTYD
jgi:hypothetical protein